MKALSRTVLFIVGIFILPSSVVADDFYSACDEDGGYATSREPAGVCNGGFQVEQNLTLYGFHIKVNTAPTVPVWVNVRDYYGTGTNECVSIGQPSVGEQDIIFDVPVSIPLDDSPVWEGYYNTSACTTNETTMKWGGDSTDVSVIYLFTDPSLADNELTIEDPTEAEITANSDVIVTGLYNAVNSDEIFMVVTDDLFRTEAFNLDVALGEGEWEIDISSFVRDDSWNKVTAQLCSSVTTQCYTQVVRNFFAVSSSTSYNIITGFDPDSDGLEPYVAGACSNTTCGISDLTGCVKEAMCWAFAPAPAKVRELYNIPDEASHIWPIGYATVALENMATFGTATTTEPSAVSVDFRQFGTVEFLDFGDLITATTTQAEEDMQTSFNLVMSVFLVIYLVMTVKSMVGVDESSEKAKRAQE